MRLPTEEIAGVKEAAAEACGPEAAARLFGGRVDDARKGAEEGVAERVVERVALRDGVVR